MLPTVASTLFVPALVCGLGLVQIGEDALFEAFLFTHNIYSQFQKQQQ